MTTTNRSWTVLVLLAALLLAGCDSKPRVGELRSESQSVKLGSEKSVNVKINLGAGDLKVNGGAEELLEADFTVRLPSQIGVRVEVETGPVTVVASDLTQEGNVYINAAYGVSKVALHINMEAGIGRINLESR